jgi:inorganic pyrophosphatase
MIRVLIQVAADSSEKRLYNEMTLEHKETRQISKLYPYPYGFIIGTRSEDGDAVDCYLITHQKLKAGSVVECEPVGLLEQNEDGEIDHKILACLPGENVELSEELLKELRDFIYDAFTQYPEVNITIGRMLPREVALSHIQKFRIAQPRSLSLRRK